ncbi:phytoene desaturase family protein [Flexibacter flexilis]|nr:NAD(P)/FAD-dependent oxidoreductase [Flexibacter flexilis]
MSSYQKYDAVIIGSGPNGLSAGIFLAQKGKNVLIIEASSTVGGGTGTKQLTLEGFQHDVCSAVHPMGYLSPYMRTLRLEEYGLEWIFPNASVAHPLDTGEVILLKKSVEETAEQLGADKDRYIRLMQPLAKHIDWLMEDSMRPLGMVKHPFFMAQFGLKALWPAQTFANFYFKEEKAKALFAGCAAHSILPFDKFFTAALGLVFLATGHAVNWPIAKGGSTAIAAAMRKCFEAHGGEIQLNQKITDFGQLPAARSYIFDTDPFQLASIASKQLPDSYTNQLRKFNFGPGVFKIDYALSAPIPWKNKAALEASTVHLGGTLAEIAYDEKQVWEGHNPTKPYILMAQQSQFDPSRSPQGKHTGWAYCHVPNGSKADMTEVIENQIERFAPGFKQTILGKYTMGTADFQAYNPNYFGGAVTGGAADITQLFTRPVARLDPYSTPNSQIFICSASTPPGGGVHGMNGYFAAQSVWKNVLS